METAWLERATLLTGEEATEKLANSSVLVVGLGGVGSYAADFLARAGVGKMMIIDGDVVDPTNKNRQLHALDSTVGQSKARLMGDRFLDINPDMDLTVREQFMEPDDMLQLLQTERFDFVLDCIDSIRPKILLINELAGSGGDFFPWVFRQQNVGKLIGMTTWGGLVKSSTHYTLIDGGGLTAPDNAVFDPINNKWIAENEGVAPDIEVRQDAKALSNGNDPQLERAVKELMTQLRSKPEVKAPQFPLPATGN